MSSGNPIHSSSGLGSSLAWRNKNKNKKRNFEAISFPNVDAPDSDPASASASASVSPYPSASSAASNKKPKGVSDFFADFGQTQHLDPAPAPTPATATDAAPLVSTHAPPPPSIQHPPATLPQQPPVTPAPELVLAPGLAPAPSLAPTPAPKPGANRRDTMSNYFSDQQQPVPPPSHRDRIVPLSDADQPTTKSSSKPSSSSARRRKSSSAHASDENAHGQPKPKRQRKHSPPRGPASKSSTRARAFASPTAAAAAPTTPAPRSRTSLAPSDTSSTPFSRRASLARRGERILKSTSPDTLYPHRSIDPDVYFRHLNPDLGPVKRVKTLAMWVGKHVGGAVMGERVAAEAALANEGVVGEQSAKAKMHVAGLLVVEAMARLALKKLKKADEDEFDWRLRPSTRPKEVKVIGKLRPNPANENMLRKIKRLEYENDLLAREKHAWMTNQADLMTHHAHLTDLAATPRAARTLDDLARTMTPDELAMLTAPLPDPPASAATNPGGVDSLTEALDACTLAARNAGKLALVRDVAVHRRCEAGREMARYIEARFGRVPHAMQPKIMAAALRLAADLDAREELRARGKDWERREAQRAAGRE